MESRTGSSILAWVFGILAWIIGAVLGFFGSVLFFVGPCPQGDGVLWAPWAFLSLWTMGGLFAAVLARRPKAPPPGTVEEWRRERRLEKSRQKGRSGPP